MKATLRLIDVLWTVEYEIVSKGQVKILNHSNQDPEGYEREYELPQFALTQTDQRIVTHLLIKPYKQGEWANKENATEIYEVVNPMHVTDYTQKITAPKIMKATKRLIRTIWTIEYEIVSEGKAKILNFSSLDEEGYKREEELPQFEMQEVNDGVLQLLTKPYKIGEWVNEANATEIFEVVNPEIILLTK